MLVACFVTCISLSHFQLNIERLVEDSPLKLLNSIFLMVKFAAAAQVTFF